MCVTDRKQRMQSNESAAHTRTINLDNVTDANRLETFFELDHLHKKFEDFYGMTPSLQKLSDDESEQIQSAAISASKPPGFHIHQSRMSQKLAELRKKKRAGQPIDEDNNMLLMLLKEKYGNYLIDKCPAATDDFEKVCKVYERVKELLYLLFPGDFVGQVFKKDIDTFKDDLITGKHDTDLALSNVHLVINEMLHYSFRNLKKDDPEETCSMTVAQYCLWIQDFFHISILHRSILQNAHHLEVGHNRHIHD